MPNTALMVASSDEHFRETVRDSIINLPETKIVSEYTEVAANLYIRVLQDLERNPHAGLIVDISGDPEGGIKAVEKVKQAAPDLFDRLDAALGIKAVEQIGCGLQFCRGWRYRHPVHARRRE